MKIDVLDHGYVELIEKWGRGTGNIPDNRSGAERMIAPMCPDYEVGIIEAARQSTQGSFRGWDQDAKLLKYLYEHHHATPFEFAGMVIEVQAPIFVFREWHRHRAQGFNEASARYSALPDLYYVPSVEHVTERATAATSNKQASGVGEFKDAQPFVSHLMWLYEKAENIYQSAIQNGIPKELARLVMPVGHYSRMRATANLRNWLSFLTLRLDPAAQYEIRQFAAAVGQIVAEVFPRTWSLFLEATGDQK